MVWKRIKQLINKKVFLNLAKKIRNVEFQITRDELSDHKLLTVGKHTYGKVNIVRNRGSDAKVEIGKYCSIASNVIFITGGIHPKDWVSLYPFAIKWHLPGAYANGTPKTNGPITIGNDVWLAHGVTILSGVNIGDGAIVATGSTVTKDLPPYSISAGVPAKVISFRFKENIISQLLRIKWWEWDDDKVKENAALLNSNQIEEFINNHKI